LVEFHRFFRLHKTESLVFPAAKDWHDRRT
jgi:hypothetical protein